MHFDAAVRGPSAHNVGMRLPFDPGRMAERPAESPPAAPGDSALTVSQLAERLTETIGAGFPHPVRVAGEVSGFKPSTHWYFSLRDAGAVMSCVMFAGTARSAPFAPIDGQQVVLTGRPDYWAKGGRTSFVATKIEPVGQGALDAAFRLLCDELRNLGWFDPARKRPVPRFPRRVAVVTAAGGAALQDVLATMRRRCPAVEVATVDVSVQGPDAPEEIARALRWLGREHRRLGVDAILVTRGGGSKEDLRAFNERIVAEAIVSSPVPVVAAIGHEVDVSIAELVADERAATPTQAAMKLTPDLPALLEQLSSAGSFLRGAMMRLVRERAQRLGSAGRHLSAVAPGRVRALAHRLETLATRLERQRPAAVYERRRATLHAARSRLISAVRRRLGEADVGEPAGALAKAWTGLHRRLVDRVTGLERQLASVGPMAVLRRGFSVTTREDGMLVRSDRDVQPGDRVRTRTADGAFRSTVEGGSLPAAPPVRGSRPADNTGSSQMDLFRPGR